jgi:DNA repair protein RadC
MDTNIQIREVQVTYQPLKGKLFQVRNSKDAFAYFSAAYNDATIGLCEEFMVLLLNRANRVLGCLKLSKGGITGTVVDVRILFATALKSMACSVILAHNHPSGNLEPSEADKELTTQITNAGRLLDIQVIDHLILGTDDDYASFADEGWL